MLMCRPGPLPTAELSPMIVLLLGVGTLDGSLDRKLVLEGEEGFGGGAMDMEPRSNAEVGPLRLARGERRRALRSGAMLCEPGSEVNR